MAAPLTRAALALACLAWALTCVTRVPQDRRAVYERFGAPAGVLQPGLHVGLPWPFGTTLPVENGTVHEIGVQTTLVVAGVQTVSADLQVFYRTGMSDADALHAAYATAQPEAMIRALAGRVAAMYFAAHTLDDVLGANSQTTAAMLRTRLQEALDVRQTGLQVIDVVVAALRPPAGAAGAGQAARDGEIAARTAIALEHGAAAAAAAQARQAAYDMTSAAQAVAGETLSHARAGLVRFDADRAAAHAGGQSYLLEHYLTALSTALAHAPKTIIDHRLNWPEAPVLDLRPYSAAAGATAGKEE